MNKEKEKEKKNPVPEKKEEQKNDELRELIKNIVSEELKTVRETMEKDFERVSAEREDAAKLANMSEDERAKFQLDKRQQDFEKERQQYVSERAEFEAAKELAAQNLPVTFAAMLADADREQMMNNISIFKTEFLKAIEAGLSQRLKGGAPRVSKEITESADPFIHGLGL